MRVATRKRIKSKRNKKNCLLFSIVSTASLLHAELILFTFLEPRPHVNFVELFTCKQNFILYIFLHFFSFMFYCSFCYVAANGDFIFIFFPQCKSTRMNVYVSTQPMKQLPAKLVSFSSPFAFNKKILYNYENFTIFIPEFCWNFLLHAGLKI